MKVLRTSGFVITAVLILFLLSASGNQGLAKQQARVETPVSTASSVYDTPLRLEPAGLAGILKGQEFDIELWVDCAEGQAVTGVAAYLDYDARYLEAVSLTPDESFLNHLTSTIKNRDGQLHCTAAAPIGGTPPGGSFRIATVRFRAKSAAESTPVSFSLSGSRRSAVVSGAGNLVAGARTDATVNIIWDTPLRLEPAGLAGILKGQEFDLELLVDCAEGQTVNGIAAYLDYNTRYLEAVSITPDESYLSYLASEINDAAGQLSYSAGAAIGGMPPSGAFRIATIRFRAREVVDVIQVSFSFGGTRQSAVIAGPGNSIFGVHTDATINIVLGKPLRLQPESFTGILKGQEFDLELLVDCAQGQTVNGVAAYLDYDPMYLEAISITPEEGLLSYLASGIDHASGQLYYSAGAAIGGMHPAGSFRIATIRFRAREVVETTQVSFSFNGNRKSAVTFGAGCVIAVANNSAVANIVLGMPLKLNPAGIPGIDTMNGEEFDLELLVDCPQGQAVNGAVAYLDYEPLYLEAVSITPEEGFLGYLASEIDNDSGQLYYSAGAAIGNMPPAGSFKIATIRFKARDATEETEVSFSLSSNRRSAVTFGAGNVIAGAYTGTMVSITPRLSLGLTVANVGVQENTDGSVTATAYWGHRGLPAYWWHPGHPDSQNAFAAVHFELGKEEGGQWHNFGHIEVLAQVPLEDTLFSTSGNWSQIAVDAMPEAELKVKCWVEAWTPVWQLVACSDRCVSAGTVDTEQ